MNVVLSFGIVSVIKFVFYCIPGPYSREKYHEALLARYEQYGPIFKENLAGETVVHVFDPDMVRQVYAADGRRPLIPALLEMRKKYRKVRDMAPGLGNTSVLMSISRYIIYDGSYM